MKAVSCIYSYRQCNLFVYCLSLLLFGRRWSPLCKPRASLLQRAPGPQWVVCLAVNSPLAGSTWPNVESGAGELAFNGHHSASVGEDEDGVGVVLPVRHVHLSLQSST